jgi:hypothetical protein
MGLKLNREVVVTSPARGYSTTAPAGAAVVKLGRHGFALRNPEQYGANAHDAAHYWFWVPDDAVEEA